MIDYIREKKNSVPFDVHSSDSTGDSICIPQERSCEAEYLASLAYEGMKKRWGEPTPPEIAERIDFELHVIKTMGCAGCFLAVHDCVEAARRMGVWVGPGRGSTASSAVAYALGITNVDPIRHGLLFERFLCPDDATARPHIAIDVEDGGCEKVVRYLSDKYGCGSGLAKFDVFRSPILSAQKCCVNLIGERDGLSVGLDKIPHDEAETMEVFARGDTGNIPEFESEDMRRWLVALKPKYLEDLAVMNALYRPGLMECISTFVRRKRGEEPIVYDHPLMERSLKDTYGVCVYQEQVILISRKLAGFTRGMSDKLLKAIGEKQLVVMDKLKVKFVDGCLANPEFRIDKWKEEGEARALCDKIWDEWRTFAPYLVSKSHAVCFACLAYQSAYLKAHHPGEFAEAFHVGDACEDGKG